MNSEDEVFRRLRKPSYPETNKIYWDWIKNIDENFSSADLNAVFERHGWSLHEFLIENQK